MSLKDIIKKELKKGRTLEFKYYKYASVYLMYDKDTDTYYTESEDPSFVIDNMTDFDLTDFAENCYLAEFTN
jgi:hypothetical protein